MQLAEAEHLLILTMHQIAVDGPSRSILIRELVTLYEAFSVGQPSPLPDLSIQYADFAHWERQWLASSVLETQLTYWREKLGSNVPPLRLPLDRPRPLTQTFRGVSQPFALSTSLSQALKTLSQQEGVTLFVTLLAALQSLLHRYTTQEDMLIFSSTARRNRPELKGLVGLLANLLPLRTDLSGNPSFRELLHRVRAVVLGAYSHQDLPLRAIGRNAAAGTGSTGHVAIPGNVHLSE